MYNIFSPLHYIAANNIPATIDVLTKYNLPAPQNHAELATAVDYAANQLGTPFLNDMARLHPDTHYILKLNNLQALGRNYGANYSNLVEDSYKTAVSSYTIAQFQNDIEGINQLLGDPESGMTAAQRTQATERLAYLQQSLALKQNPASSTATNTTTTTTTTPATDIATKSHYLLVGLVALALIYIGTKIKITAQ